VVYLKDTYNFSLAFRDKAFRSISNTSEYSAITPAPAEMIRRKTVEICQCATLNNPSTGQASIVHDAVAWISYPESALCDLVTLHHNFMV